ncbi:site-specific DNA-methyltransferase [bacterium]|nr:site-specific DNA-methyltransferase [bacterium]
MNIQEKIDTIILGDSIKVMSEIPDDSFDMTFADPPFNLKKKYNNYKDTREFSDYLNWCKSWLAEMVRITKPTGSIFVHNIPKWLTYYAHFLNDIAHFRHWISWDALGAPLGKTLLPTHYGILFYVKFARGFKFNDIRYPHKRCRSCKIVQKDYGGKKYLMHPYGPLCSDVWTDIHRIRHKKRRDEHPCQLPVPLLERLILMSTDENDIVFDPFIGTGTTAIAAKHLGRHFMGIDIDPKYVETASKKVSLELPTKINDFFVSKYLGKVVTIRDKDWEKMEKYFPTDQLECVEKKEKSLEPLKKIKKGDVGLQLPI